MGLIGMAELKWWMRKGLLRLVSFILAGRGKGVGGVKGLLGDKGRRRIGFKRDGRARMLEA